jgi:hypothetical protein
MKCFQIFLLFIFIQFPFGGQAQKKLKPCKSGKMVGYCDESGKAIIPHQFFKAGPFQGNIAPVVRNAPTSTWWYIDKEGNFLFDTKCWPDRKPVLIKKGIYKVQYYDPDLGKVVEYYNKNGLPVNVNSEDSIHADTIIYTVFSAKEAIQFAKSKIGIRSKISQQSCFDFIHSIYKPFGIILPVFPRELFAKGKPVLPDNIQPGDLVFFSGSNLSDTTVQYIGMVISTEGNKIEFIHSCSTKGITINNTSEDNFARRLQFARRVFG